MNEKELAFLLRQRQIQKAPKLASQLSVDESTFIQKVKSLSDKDIILSYIICFDCGKMQCSYQEALFFAERASTVDEWFDNLDRHYHR